MVSKTRVKGNRTVRRAIEYYEKKGWKVDKVEKTGKFVVEKDLFGLFDLAAIKKNKVLFIQVKTNKPATQLPYKLFARKYSGKSLGVEVYTWYDRKGPVIQVYQSSGKIKKIDLRK